MIRYNNLTFVLQSNISKVIIDNYQGYKLVVSSFVDIVNFMRQLKIIQFNYFIQYNKQMVSR